MWESERRCEFLTCIPAAADAAAASTTDTFPFPCLNVFAARARARCQWKRQRRRRPRPSAVRPGIFLPTNNFVFAREPRNFPSYSTTTGADSVAWRPVVDLLLMTFVPSPFLLVPFNRWHFGIAS